MKSTNQHNASLAADRVARRKFRGKPLRNMTDAEMERFIEANQHAYREARYRQAVTRRPKP